ncbi:MAG: DUF4838 domain-containing protein [Armatimonadetes bacterium]|nr:DUF4838 domain-containing protein [Armatimonadota bacterium]
MRRLVAAIISAVVMSSPAPALQLAGGGRALAPIVVPEAAHPTAAVRDLVEYLGRITGARFKLLSAADYRGGAAVCWGPDYYRPSDTDATRSPWLVRQIVQIYTDDHALYLTGGGPDGCEFAVYAFLEDVCGVRFFHPGALGVHVPQQPELSIEDLNIRQAPSFLYRYMWPSARTPDRRMYREWKRWLPRSRQGGPIVAMGHNLYRIVPPELYDEHPDYFPLIAGVRVDPRSGAAWQPELASPGVVRLAADKARAWFDAHPDAWSFSLSMNDSEGWSESPEALEQDPPQFRGSQTEGKARRMIIFANRVAEALAATHPDRYLVFYAYKSTLQPPEEPACLPNVVPALCHWGVSKDPFHPITAPRDISPANTYYRSAIAGWSHLADKLIAREYWCGPGYDPLLKAGIAPVLFEDIPYYHARGFVACDSEAEIDWGDLALNHYIASRLMWDVTLDPEELLADYFDKYYGAAAEPMRAYFTRIWEAAYRHYLPEEIRVELTSEDLDRLDGLLQQAAGAVADDELRAARVKMARDFLQVYRAWRSLMQTDPTDAQIADYLALLQRMGDEKTDALVVNKWAAMFVCAPPEPKPYDGPALVRAVPGAPLPAETRPLAARHRGTWLALVGEDRVLRARACGVRVARRYTQRPCWQVVSAGGEAIAGGNTPIDGCTEIEAPVPSPGLYQVNMNAGKNGCAFVGLNCPVVMVGPGYELCEIPGRMYFRVPEDCERFTITLFAGKSESALMRIYDPGGEIVFEEDSLKRDVVPAHFQPTDDQRGKAWAVEIEKASEGILEDYQLLLSDELEPYLATSPEALLTVGGQ